ncbi:hypothetical protein [Streptomyces sp. NPDC088146]|uniref:hypothetical protein n=1 Tax=Streptomyces sp. NPDC088146 TaxID=3365829 RepID=UPI00380F53A1
MTRNPTCARADFTAYWAHRARLDRWAAALYDRYDLLLMPTTPTTAWPADGPDVATAVCKRALPISCTAVQQHRPPRHQHPHRHRPDGLPLAVRLIAPHHREDFARTATRTIESAYGTRCPPALA